MMDITLDNQRYVFQWSYVDNEELTAEFIKAHVPRPEDYAMVRLPNGREGKKYIGHIPLKPHNYVGMAICRVKVPIGEEELARMKAADPEFRQTLAVLFEGYSFRLRGDGLVFDKKTARRYSLAHALQGQLTKAAHTAIWTNYNAYWPPIKPEMNRWKKRYEEVAMENAKLRMDANELGERILRLMEEADRALGRPAASSQGD